VLCTNPTGIPLVVVVMVMVVILMVVMVVVVAMVRDINVYLDR
jgi:hypothetical protein